MSETKKESRNEIAKKLEQAITVAPYLIEKERYQMAINEINRLQDQLDEILGDDDPNDWKKTIYSGQPWHADEDGSTVRVFCENAQVFKAPKKGTQYAEYWPNPELLKWMLRVMNEAEKRGDRSPPAMNFNETQEKEMKLKWHNTDQDQASSLESIVMKDIERLDIDSPSNLVFHHVFLSKRYDGPCVFVWGEKDSDYFNCEYVEDPQWSKGDEP